MPSNILSIFDYIDCILLWDHFAINLHVNAHCTCWMFVPVQSSMDVVLVFLTALVAAVLFVSKVFLCQLLLCRNVATEGNVVNCKGECRHRP